MQADAILARANRHAAEAKRYRVQAAEYEARALEKEADAKAAMADYYQARSMQDETSLFDPSTPPPGFKADVWAAACEKLRAVS